MTVIPQLSAADRAMWAACARAFGAGAAKDPRKARTPGELAQILDPKTVQTPALDLIDAALVDAAEGRCDRLMISVPPQEGKSVRISRRFPEWLLTRNPELRIAIVSYAHGVARRHGRAIRDDIGMHSELGLTVNPNSSAAHEWELTGHQGGVYCVGITGSLTSRPVDCLRGNTRVLTEYGYAAIESLVDQDRPPPRVLSYNHATQRTEWRRIIATRAIGNRPLVEVVTASGRRITCTPDHRIYAHGRGYIRANQLRPGDRLLAARASAGQMPALFDGNYPLPVNVQEVSRRNAALLLQGVPEQRGVDGAYLRGLRRQVHEASLRGREGGAQRLHPDLLHEGVLPVHGEQGSARAGNGAHPGAANRARDQQRARAHRVGPAPVLHARDRSAVGRCKPETAVRAMRRDSQEQECDLSSVLSGRPSFDVPDDDVHTVLDTVRENAGRAGVPRAGGADERLLPVRLSPPVDAREQPVGALWPLRNADQGRRRQALLLGGLPDCGPQRAAGVEESALPAVRCDLHSEVVPAAVLRSDLRGPGALRTHGWHGELALQGRHQLRRVVPADASADPGARRQRVPSVQGARPAGADRTQRSLPMEVAAGGSPPKRGAGGQPARELDPSVLALPHAAPQVGYDTVSVVRELCGVRDTVYDIQVDGNCNFFAEEVLVHNCLIVDDPYKNGEQADSEAWQETVRDFWTEVAIPRLGPGAIVIIVQTRWRHDDLSGWLQAEDEAEGGGRWRVINIPAQADHDPNKGEADPLGRVPGEYLESARGRTVEQWEQKKIEVGSRTWTALYQGHPTPSKGNIFHRHWWQFYDQPQWVERDDGTCWAVSFDEVVASWDMSFKDTEGTDYVCGQVWGRRGVEAFLLDQVHDRLSFVDTCVKVRTLSARWPQAALKLVEDKANGPAVMNALARKVGGLVPEQPQGSKVARAAAVSPFVEAGNVWLPAPELAPWVDELIEECQGFPRSANDDRVDAMSQALNRLLLSPLMVDDVLVEDAEVDEYEISRY